MRPAAFLDLDGTLLGVNSGRLWVQFERRLGRISRRTYAEAMLYLVAYHLNRIDMDRVMRKALSSYRGESEAGVREKTRRWYLDEVAPRVAKGAASVLAQHRGQGHDLVLLTSSSVYESEIACEHMGLDGFICTRYEVAAGAFTGEPVLPVCYGAGKVELAERYARAHAIDLERSYFYSDSGSDLPMLERVAHPRVVNPDPTLRRAALARGWPVLDWSR